MDTNKSVDTASEPVDYDDGIIDTGVLYESPEEIAAAKKKKEDQDGDDE